MPEAPSVDRRRLLVGATAMTGGLAIGLGSPRAAAAAAGSSSNAPASKFRWPSRPLLKPDLGRSLVGKALAKPVHDTRVIDDMESELGWQATPAVRMSYTTDRAKAGTRSLRASLLMRDEAYIAASRRPNGSFSGQGVLFDGMPGAASLHLRFATPQDWSGFNRISLWCYVHPTKNPIHSLSLGFTCAGATAGPTDPVATHYLGDFTPGAWNLLTWEIPEYQRDKVVEFVIMASIFGSQVEGADPEVTYDFDKLQLERVDAEPVDGWQVIPGKIAFSHTGYGRGAQKIAVAAAGAADFQLLDAASGAVVASYPATPVVNRHGRFSRLDFSAFTRAGRHRLRCAGVISEPFAIGDDGWRELVDATLNSFYGFRCGFAVPGVHDACHCDVFVDYQGDPRVVGGGWHDAGNLTQGPGRTHLSIYGLMRLYEQVVAMGDKDLADRVLEEARWGIEWSLRLRYGPGLRCLYGTYSYYTDGKAGTADDVVQDNVGVDVFQNILATLATATAGRMLKAADPALSAELLKAAEEDFATCIAARPAPPAGAPPINLNEGCWRDEVGYLTLAAVELHRATGKPQYQAAAARLGGWLLAQQEQSFVDGIPVAGYWYEDAGRTRIVHEFHHGFEDSGLLALQALTEEFPDHPQWIDWYAGLVIYSEFFCRAGATASAPFDVIPAAVWRRSDLAAAIPADHNADRLAAHPNPLFPTPPTPALVAAQCQAQYDAGVQLGPNHSLRIFPLWYDHIRHGATVVQLGKTAGLAAAAQARGRRDLADMAQRQLQWVTGANPLSRSLIFGVGYDWWQNFSTCMPNLVGGLSLGFNSYRDDAPAWGNNAVFPYKEQWIFSSSRMALNLASIGAPARLTGQAPAGATLRHRLTGQTTKVRPGRFAFSLEGGDYDVSYGDSARTLSLVDGARLTLDLDPDRRLDIEIAQSVRDGAVRIAVRLSGKGRHRLDWRLFNAAIADIHPELDLGRGGEIRLDLALAVADPDKPWVLAIVPNGQAAGRHEVFGVARDLPSMAALTAANSNGARAG